MTHWKTLKADYSSPIQGGQSLCDGVTWPVVLPTVALDTSSQECGVGWNCTREPDIALQIGGMWGKLLVVEPTADVIERGDKCRSSGMTLIREATETEWYEAIEALSWPLMDVPDMVTEQMLWHDALSSTTVDASAVEQGLHRALQARGLKWSVKQHGAARAAWAEWDARDARDARDAWAEWDARDAMDAWAAWAAWDAWAEWAEWDAMNAWAARSVRDALTVYYTASRDWIKYDPMLLTTGLRDAYAAGLSIAIPTGPNELGYALREVAQ